jgi:peptidoglycan/LPS O-acetylase OafA/YrhL
VKFPDLTILMRIAVIFAVFAFALGLAVARYRRHPRVSLTVRTGGFMGLLGIMSVLLISPHHSDTLILLLLTLGTGLISLGVFLDRGHSQGRSHESG